MSRAYIPPFPTGNTSSDTQYTQYFEKARTQRRPGNPPEPVSGNPTTPPNPRHREPDPPRVTASPLHQGYLPRGRSPLHQQGNNGSGSYGSSRPGNSHKPVNPNNPSYPSPKPSKNSASGRSQEGLIGYGTPARNTPSRNKKKPVEQDPYDDLLPPFPTDGTNANYTEVFTRYQKDNMSPAPPPIVPHTPRREESSKPKLQRCSCFGL